MNKPVTRRGAWNGKRGEFSTVELSNGVVETLHFPDDGSEVAVIGRTVPDGLRTIQARHIQDAQDGN